MYFKDAKKPKNQHLVDELNQIYELASSGVGQEVCLARYHKIANELAAFITIRDASELNEGFFYTIREALNGGNSL